MMRHVTFHLSASWTLFLDFFKLLEQIALRSSHDISSHNCPIYHPHRPKKEKKDKKRKDKESDAEEKPKKKAKADAADADEAPAPSAEKMEADALALDNFELHPLIKDKLRERGVASLFPIQAACLDHAVAGLDVVGRARTGCGKTLAFVLPLVQMLLAESGSGKRPHGRTPAVIVLAPTRELAKQVGADFETIGQAANLSVLTVYGGSPYQPQEAALRRGVDIVIGTPGRIKVCARDGEVISLSCLICSTRSHKPCGNQQTFIGKYK